MLRSIGKQSEESADSVVKELLYAVQWEWTGDAGRCISSTIRGDCGRR